MWGGKQFFNEIKGGMGDKKGEARKEKVVFLGKSYLQEGWKKAIGSGRAQWGF